MSQELFNRVYDLLVERGGAEDTPRKRSLFVSDHAELAPQGDEETEVRFCGKLEMGGKFRCDPRSGFTVECYPETLERKPELKALVDEMNEDLKSLHREWIYTFQSPDRQAALATLRAAGLKAAPSRLEPGGIIAGIRTHASSHGGFLYEYGSLIVVEPNGFRAAVPGPGNGASETLCPTLKEAAEAVVKEYRRRDWIK